MKNAAADDVNEAAIRRNARRVMMAIRKGLIKSWKLAVTCTQCERRKCALQLCESTRSKSPRPFEGEGWSLRFVSVGRLTSDALKAFVFLTFPKLLPTSQTAREGNKT